VNWLQVKIQGTLVDAILQPRIQPAKKIQVRGDLRIANVIVSSEHVVRIPVALCWATFEIRDFRMGRSFTARHREGTAEMVAPSVSADQHDDKIASPAQ
jgi:hypothetical protein